MCAHRLPRDWILFSNRNILFNAMFIQLCALLSYRLVANNDYLVCLFCMFFFWMYESVAISNSNSRIFEDCWQNKRAKWDKKEQKLRQKAFRGEWMHLLFAENRQKNYMKCALVSSGKEMNAKSVRMNLLCFSILQLAFNVDDWLRWNKRANSSIVLATKFDDKIIILMQLHWLVSIFFFFFYFSIQWKSSFQHILRIENWGKK